MANVKELLAKLNIHPNKALGQNFLADDTAVNDIINLADIDNKPVIEIGSGLGALTFELNARAKKLVAIEIDKCMIAAIESQYSQLAKPESFTLTRADILKVDLESIATDLTTNSERICVVGNLPYYITTPICMRLLSLYERVETITLMMQREVASRILAKPCDNQYSPLSVLGQYMYDIKIGLELSPSAYYPQPEVYSVVISMRARDYDVKIAKNLSRIVKACFVMRRKTLQNNLMSCGFDRNFIIERLSRIGISPSSRAETLNVDEFVVMTETLIADE